MKKRTNTRLSLAILFALALFSSYAQVQELKLNPEKVKKYTPYLEFRHGGPQNFPTWKENNKLQYAKEMWYFSESFYVKRNYLNEGVTLDESIIDISRFEASRKDNEEVIVTLPGFKDVLVLMPGNKLIYKP